MTRRSVESGVSNSTRTTVPIAAAIPPTFAQHSVFSPKSLTVFVTVLCSFAFSKVLTALMLSDYCLVINMRSAASK